LGRDFAEKIAFAASGSPTSRSPPIVRSFSGTRLDSTPAALRRVGCPAARAQASILRGLTTELTLAPGDERSGFALGQADSLAEVHRLIGEYTQSHRADAA
jgi:hypothetical protein